MYRILRKVSLKVAKQPLIYKDFQNTPIRLLSTAHLPHIQPNLTSKPNQEHEFLVKLKNNPDVFGSGAEIEVVDADDLKEEKFLENQPAPGQRKSTKQYADHIKQLIDQRKIKEAIDYVEVKMIKEDRVKPENYIFNLLLGACGRVGYTKKAFSLYNQMKKRGLKVTAGTYTALFNACANSPWPEDGLTRAKHLREIMLEKGDEPNDSNYNAMIKAFGRCGDLGTAFSLVDEMITKKMPLSGDVMNFLLQACISDKEAGFRHSLLVWRKMTIKRIRPNLFTYNLMLRCIRDCGIGDTEVTLDVLGQILRKNLKEPAENNENLLLLNDASQEIKKEGENLEFQVVDNKVTAGTSQEVNNYRRPNLMSKTPHLGNIISISEIKRAEDRLLLVGGLKGFLENMENDNITPNIKTFTQLLDTIPSNLESERELMLTMKKHNILPDIDFYNMLIKKRSMRLEYDQAKNVLKLISKAGLQPNLITYGVLALSCKTRMEALCVLQEMKERSYGLNIEILGAMLRQACHHMNFSYVTEIMELSVKEDVKPNKKFMEHLSKFRNYCKKISNNKNNPLRESTIFQRGFKAFQQRYKTWLTEVVVDDSEDKHPWQQFRQNTETDGEFYKEKSVRFKPRHISRFRVKTSAKHNKK